MDDREQHLKIERVNMLAAQIRRTRLSSAVAVIVLCALFVPSVGTTQTLIWGVVMIVAFRLRDRFISRLIEETPLPAKAEDKIALSSAALSVVINSPGALFLPQMSAEISGVYVAIAVSWLAIAVLIIGIHPRAYTLYVATGFVLLAIGWWQRLSPYTAAFATLSMFGGAVILVGFSRELARTFNASFRIRHERDALVRDLTRSIAQTEDAQNQRSRILAQTSHDLLQPVHALMLLTGVLRDSVSQEKREEAVERVEITARSIETMFRGLLDQARLDQGAVLPQRTDVTLARVFRSVEAAYAPRCEKKGIRFATSCPEHACVSADPALLDRVLRNLVDNAVKFTDEGGVTLSAVEEEDRIRVYVEDSGIGISPSDLVRVTEAFFRGGENLTGTPGIGLGLSVAQQLVELMDGSIAIESAPGRGSRIEVALQRSLGRVETDAEDRGGHRRSIEGRQILVLEDNIAAREALDLWLVSNGARVRAFGTVDEALAAVGDGNYAPDHLLIDFHLGDGPNGIEAISSIRESVGDVPAALITGAPISAEVLPADIELLRKPLTPQILLDVLERGGEGETWNASRSPGPSGSRKSLATTAGKS